MFRLANGSGQNARQISRRWGTAERQLGSALLHLLETFESRPGTRHCRSSPGTNQRRHRSVKMRATSVLRQWTIRTTLFTRPNCSLCTEAKEVMAKVWDRRPYEFTEINVMEPKQEKWKALYEFDTPVV